MIELEKSMYFGRTSLPLYKVFGLDSTGSGTAYKFLKTGKEYTEEKKESIKDFEASAKSGADNAGELAKINKEFADNANKLTTQMESLAKNLESLNNVYGGVLNAMNKK